LEGPLSPQDNAYEVLGLAKNGHRIFEVLSRYDDILTLEGRKNYEPGDTLKLIVPFLIYHGITEEDIKKVSSKAKIVGYAAEIIDELKKMGWNVRIISTSYQQHAYYIGNIVGVRKENIACTYFPLDKYNSKIRNKDLAIVEKLEDEIIKDFPKFDESQMLKRLDEFFYKELIDIPLGKIFKEIKVIGGQQKVDSLLDFIRIDEAKIAQSIAIGDSITDYKMLKTVRNKRGLAITFNGNEFSIPYANIGVASEDLRPILTFAKAFANGNRREAIKLAKKIEKQDSTISCLENADKKKLDETIKIHEIYRKKIRGAAGNLG
jgi:energy-converting hydrogenase A subunit R|tara:strand:+ start:8925 stop:9884 length:960 start_codon:yes stop_codon:yes gene_type:complete